MRLYKILSVLLEYPEHELLEALPELRAALQAEKLSADERRTLETFLDWLTVQDLTDLQADYVQTFDLAPEHSLHLTHHLFGDDKGRGPALIDLAEHYRSYGLESDERELPDYLPLILEFVSTLEGMEAQVFLGQTAKVMSQLATNLEQAQSPWAPVLKLIATRGRLVPATA